MSTYSAIQLGPPLKKMLFPVQRPGDFITAEWELYFFILPFFWGEGVNISSFSYPKKKKKKKGFAAARLATISATRYTGNKHFFKGGLVLCFTLLNYRLSIISAIFKLRSYLGPFTLKTFSYVLYPEKWYL